jgi:hypothetical protein
MVRPAALIKATIPDCFGKWRVSLETSRSSITTNLTPSDEQAAVIEAALAGESMRVLAFAGTGEPRPGRYRRRRRLLRNAGLQRDVECEE